MRGKPLAPAREGGKLGITPADAGKTSRRNANACLSWDHPRGCGENCMDDCIYGMEEGSPPRMRGKLELFGNPEPFNRITPADAGKTEDVWEFLRHYGDHPRGCGENTYCLGRCVNHTGSPPRMRGKLHMG